MEQIAADRRSTTCRVVHAVYSGYSTPAEVPKLRKAGSATCRENGGRNNCYEIFKRVEAGVLSMHAAGFQCAGCGEWVETAVDESAGSKQHYVEDCQVCCQPNVLTIRWDLSAQAYTIHAELES